MTVDIKTDNNSTVTSLPGENKKNRGNCNIITLSHTLSLSLSLSQGFAFVDFESPEEAQELCRTHFITIDSRQVEAKKAEPRHKKGGPGSGGGTAKDGTVTYQQSSQFLSPSINLVIYFIKRSLLWRSWSWHG